MTSPTDGRFGNFCHHAAPRQQCGGFKGKHSRRRQGARDGRPRPPAVPGVYRSRLYEPVYADHVRRGVAGGIGIQRPCSAAPSTKAPMSPSPASLSMAHQTRTDSV